MNKNISFFLCLIALSICFDNYPSENGVFLINEENFGLAMHEYKYLLILFYSRDDPNCQDIIPEFEKTANLLKKENYASGKIDSDESPKIIRHFNLEIFPSIVLIKKTVPTTYEGEKKADQIINWLKEKTKKEYKKISTNKELEEFKKEHDTSFVYFGKNEKIIDEINLAERKMDDIPMGLVNNDALIKENAKSEDKKEYIVLFTKFDEGKYYLYDFKYEKIIEFYNLYFTPKVIEFAAQTSPILFAKRFPSLIIFSLKRESHYEESKKALSQIWPKVNTKLKLFISDIEEGMSVRLAEYCGVKENQLPTTFILIPDSENPIKYRMEGKVTEENLLQFVENWNNKKLKPFLKSENEPDPEENDGDVFVVVGKTYKKEVLDNDKDVVVYFYAPWCEHCKEFYPKYEKLARKLKKKNPHLLLTKVDSTENDIENFPINKYPTIKFYPGNAKNKQPIHFYNKQTIDDLLNLIKEKAYHKINDEDYEVKKEKLTTDL